MMKKRSRSIWLFWVALSIAPLSSAAPFTTALTAGQWQINTQTFADGQDIGPKLSLIKQQAVAFLKPKQVAKLERYDPRQFNECLSSKQAAILTDPEKTIAVLGQAIGQCDLKIDSQDNRQSRVSFSGYCNDSKYGIEGNVTGQVHYQSAIKAVGFVEGVGTLPPHMQLLLTGRMQPQVHIKNNFTAQWQQASCLIGTAQ